MTDRQSGMTVEEIEALADKEFEGVTVDSGNPLLDEWLIGYAKALFCQHIVLREMMYGRDKRDAR